MSTLPLELGWNKLCMLFLMGGFSSWIERMLFEATFSSFRPLLVFLELLCFFAWWVGVRLLGESEDDILSTEEMIWGFVM